MRIPHITKREAEILKLVCDGKRYWEIAALLGLSKYTVCMHMQNFREKFELSDKTSIVRWAIRERIVEP
jgi:DNA-binding CsgD family transcriptional regulator